MKKNNFLKNWITDQKFTIGLSIFCGFAPVLLNLMIESSKFGNLNVDVNICMDVANMLFIFITLIILVKSNFLIDTEAENKPKLYKYVQNELKQESELVTQGEDVLFKRIDISIKQFYYSWVVIWTIWLLLYLGKLIFSAYSNFMNNNIPDEMFRLSCLFENSMNLVNSFTMFFIYMVMTISTVKISMVSHHRSQMHIAIILLIFLGFGTFLMDMYSMYVIDYDLVQFYIRLFIGIIATISFMAVLGRLNSSYLDIPQGIIMCLYLYASLQMLYPFVNIGDDKSKNVSLPVVDAVKYLNWFFYILAFIGKILLFMVIKWIIQKNRFLFFIIRKANSMSESNEMLKTFNRFYGNGKEEEYID
jgi:hypothetical protein